MKVDQLLDKLNPVGPYQLLVWVLYMLFANIYPSWHMFSITFTGFFPSDYGCRNSTVVETANSSRNVTTEYLSIPKDRCHVTVNKYDGLLVSSSNQSCPDGQMWYTGEDPITSTVITEWNLVCDKERIFAILSAIQPFGMVIGCLLFGYIADRQGRKKALFFGGFSMFSGGMLGYFAPNPYAVMVSRFVVGLGIAGLLNSGSLMGAELFPPKVRAVFSTSAQFLWVLGMLLVTMIAYFVRDHFNFILVITLPLLFMVPAWWFLRESVRWDIGQGNAENAKATLLAIARFNRVSIDETTVDKVVDKEVDSVKVLGEPIRTQRSFGVRDLVKTPRLRLITIFLIMLWFANSLFYYGLQFSSQLGQSVSLYVSFLILGAVEVPATVAAIIFMRCTGRRWSIIGFQVLGGSFCIAEHFIGYNGIEGFVLSCFAKGTGIAAFIILFVYALELFPTQVRGLGFGSIAIIGRLGIVLVPFVHSLGYGEESSIFPKWARPVIYGGAMIVTGFLTLLLPETNNRPLPETIEDIEDYENFCDKYATGHTLL